MAPIAIKIDPTKNLTTFVCTEQIKVDEFLSKVKENITNNPTKDILWDMTDCDTEMREPEVNKLFNFLKYAHETGLVEKRSGGKTALVVSKTYMWGLLRQMKAWSETVETVFQIQVFNNMKEAMDWFEES